MEFGQIKVLDLRTIWKSEPGEFTPWLSQNLDKLGDVIGLELEFESSETSIGDFAADIVAKDVSRNRLTVIENQFGQTDHKHLGQIITYAAGLNSGTVIWISENFREEHRQAIDWLNQNSKENLEFYGLEIQVIQIDNSKPAYVFKPIAFPNQFSKTSIISDKETSETRQQYQQFFQTLIDELRTKYKFTNAKVGQPQNWYTFASDNSKIYKYSFSFAMGERVRSEIYIDSGDGVKNKDIFDKLFAKKDEIEKQFGQELSWERLDTKRASRIAVYMDGSIDNETEELNKIKQWGIETLLKFKEVFPSKFK